MPRINILLGINNATVCSPRTESSSEKRQARPGEDTKSAKRDHFLAPQSMKVLIAFFGLKKNAQLPFCACQIKTKTARALGNIFNRRGSVYNELEGVCFFHIILQDSPNNSNTKAVCVVWRNKYLQSPDTLYIPLLK